MTFHPSPATCSPAEVPQRVAASSPAMAAAGLLSSLARRLLEDHHNDRDPAGARQGRVKDHGGHP